MSSPMKGEVQSWPIENVIPYEKNAKIHDPAQVSKIARSIREYGWDQPIVVDGEGVVIKGHGRRLAAIELGMKFVPVVVRTDLTPEQVKAARLADNRVAEGGIDHDLLQKELMDLASTDLDLTSMGFEERELAFLTEDLGDMDMDSLIDDLDKEVTEQAERVEKKVREVEKSTVLISDALGFKTVPLELSRTIARFMAQLEEQTGKKGADAFGSFVSSLVE